VKVSFLGNRCFSHRLESSGMYREPAPGLRGTQVSIATESEIADLLSKQIPEPQTMALTTSRTRCRRSESEEANLSWISVEGGEVLTACVVGKRGCNPVHVSDSAAATVVPCTTRPSRQ